MSAALSTDDMGSPWGMDGNPQSDPHFSQIYY